VELPAGYDNWKLDSGRENEMDMEMLEEEYPIKQWIEDSIDDETVSIYLADCVYWYGDSTGDDAASKLKQLYEAALIARGTGGV